MPVRRERRSVPDMRTQQRIRRPAVQRVEHDHRAFVDDPVAGERGRISRHDVREVGPVGRVFRLAEIERIPLVGLVDGPVPDTGVLIGFRHAGRRQLRPDPPVDVPPGEDGAIGHRPAKQPDRIDGSRGCRSVGQRPEPWLCRVVDTPECPHARDVVACDVAVEEKVAGRLLHAACAALDLEVVRLAGPEGL